VIWDISAIVTDEGMQKLLLGNGSGEKVVVKYPSEGGYSPGDTRDGYVDADGRVQEVDRLSPQGTEEAQRRHCTPDRLLVLWSRAYNLGCSLIDSSPLTSHRQTASKCLTTNRRDCNSSI
jgi:hypothetical protein